MWRTPRDPRRLARGRPERRARSADAPRSRDPRASRRAATTPAPPSSPRRARCASNVISSQGVHDRYGGVVPEVAARHHLTLINDVVDDALRTADADARRRRPRRRHPGARARRRAARRAWPRPRAWPPARGLPLAPVDHLQGHVAANFLGGDGLRAAVPVPDRVAAATPSWRASRSTPATRSSGGRSTTPPARPSTRARACSACPIPGGPALERLAAEGDPGAFDFPIAAGVPGLDFSFAGLKTALLYKVRDLGDEAQARRRADLAAAYQHAIVEALALRVERGLRADRPGAPGHRRRRGGQRAPARADGRPRGRAARPGAGAVHRQRGDDRLRGALGRRRCASSPTSTPTPAGERGL